MEIKYASFINANETKIGGKTLMDTRASGQVGRAHVRCSPPKLTRILIIKKLKYRFTNLARAPV